MNTAYISSEAQELHTNLEQQLGRLRFTEPLEEHFLIHLRTSQHLSALCTLCIVTLVWLFYAGLDVWRLNELAGTAYESEFFWRSAVIRWWVLLCFACMIYCLLNKNTPRRTYEVCLAGCVLACCMGIAASSYTLKNSGMQETSVVLVLVVGVALFPFGVRLWVMGPTAIGVCLITTLAGPLLLRDPDFMKPHWVLSAVMWVGLILTGITAYYREKSLREQFLLRRLLDWEASHDPLTGLANRRMFHEHLNTCMRQAHRQRETLFLAILDVDHFKLYNDHYGHSAGDDVLRHIARLLQHYARRPMDLAVRLGGEEFALVIYGMPPQQLTLHLQQLQAELTQQNLAHAASATAPYVTVSIGATLVHPQDSQDNAIQRADGLLYQAKREGRNRACIQTQDPAALRSLIEQVH